MSEQRSKPTKTEDVSRVEDLLDLLRDLSPREPSPDLRERLRMLAAQRLNENRAPNGHVREVPRSSLVWLKAAFATVLLSATTLTAIFVAHFRHNVKPATRETANVSHPAAQPDNEAAMLSTASSLVTPLGIKPAHSQTAPLRRARRMTMRLPYSNSAIETGTDATIRVLMSQSELMSLGFPINATVQDRRIVAELTLGDDGLPRAISLPLPLEVMKENR